MQHLDHKKNLDLGLKELLIFISSFVFLVASALASPNQLKLVVVDKVAKSNFERTVEPLIKTSLNNCKGCELLNLSPYNSSGEFEIKSLKEKLSEIQTDFPAVLAFNWNERLDDNNKEIRTELIRLSEAGVTIVAPTGMSTDNQPSLPLSQTLIGSVPKAIIIGSLEGKERLPKTSYYGPQMLTAIYATDDTFGREHLLVATSLLNNWNKKPQIPWVEHLRAQKERTRKIWPSIKDLIR
jgi:hypothetical protein